MAEKTIEMLRKNADGTYTRYNPKTLVENVTGAAKQADLAAHLADNTKHVSKDGTLQVGLNADNVDGIEGANLWELHSNYSAIPTANTTIATTFQLPENNRVYILTVKAVSAGDRNHIATGTWIINFFDNINDIITVDLIGVINKTGRVTELSVSVSALNKEVTLSFTQSAAQTGSFAYQLTKIKGV